jgi:hypothetical protein
MLPKLGSGRAMNSFGARTRISRIGDVADSARPFAQASFGVGLQAKRDAAKKKLLVRGFRFLAEQFPVSLLECGDLRICQLFNRSNNGWIHGLCSSLVVNHSSMDAPAARQSKRRIRSVCRLTFS